MNATKNKAWGVFGLAVVITVLATTSATATTPVADALAALTDQLAELGTAIGEAGAMRAWLGLQFDDPERVALWRALATRLPIAIGGGWALAFLTRLALGPAIRRVEGREAPTWWVRIPIAAGRFLLIVIPAAVFAATAAIIVEVMEPADPVPTVIFATVAALALGWMAVAFARGVLSPLVPALRPVPLADGTAAYLFVWARRLINFLVFALLLTEVAILLEAPQSGSLLLAKALGLIFCLLLVVLILQNRATVAGWIAGDKEGLMGWRLFRERLGDVWHVLAILYLGVTWAVWTVEVPGGFGYVAGNTAATAGVVAVAWVAVWAAGQALRRMFEVGEELRKRYPFVAERADLYLPLVRRTIAAVIQIVAALVVLGIWGADVLAWFGSDLGRDLVGRAISIAVILAVALAAWEVANAAIRILMERKDESGQELVRSQRARTLLPLIRNALAVVIGVMAGMVVLSELGVSIGPLLAGAGVAGLAFGFGAQTLVKDFITGLFILMEDSIHVGDVVRVAGKAGTVEALTVRTVRLRDLHGVVHTVPFSSVDVIENMSKEYSQAVIDVGVGYRENYDDVVAVLKAISEELRADPDYGPKILEPMLVLGLDELADSAVIIRVRIKTEPSQQWGLRREFNRRVKARFDELGIEIPYPHRTVYFGEDRQGNAPPLRHRAEPENK